MPGASPCASPDKGTSTPTRQKSHRFSISSSAAASNKREEPVEEVRTAPHALILLTYGLIKFPTLSSHCGSLLRT